jgi:hypothetical protein
MKEDYSTIKEKIKKDYVKTMVNPKERILDEDLLDYFFTRVRSNFHMMICMSKVKKLIIFLKLIF